MIGRHAVALVFSGILFLGVAEGAHADSRLAKLAEQDRALAEDYTRFIEAIDQKYFGVVAALNDGSKYAPETLEIENEYSDYDIKVTRGPVVEKFGRMLAFGNKTSPGRGDRVLTWGRFYSLDAHPRTPLVGMLHATIVLQFFETGDPSATGWLGVMPATRIDEDLAALKALTDAHFAEHDKQPDLYRRLICKGTEDTVARWRRRPACSGVSFYGPPVFPGEARRSFEFIAALFDDFVGTYFQQVETRTPQAFTLADQAAQDDMRRRWLLDQLFSDPYSSKIVPFEAWSLANMPPEVKF
jgi:coproporphyrinogen III oxidase